MRTGDIVIDLGRPWDLQTALLATDFGRAGYAVLMRLVPPMAFGALFFPFRWPERPVTWALFAVSMAAGHRGQLRHPVPAQPQRVLAARRARRARGVGHGRRAALRADPAAGLVPRVGAGGARVDAVPGVVPDADRRVHSSAATRSPLLAHQLFWAAALFALGRAGARPREPAAGGAGWVRSVYARIVASRIRSQLAYPASFALDVFSQLLGQSMELLAILVIFTQVTLAGRVLGGRGRADLRAGRHGVRAGRPAPSGRWRRCPTTSAPASST